MWGPGTTSRSASNLTGTRTPLTLLFDSVLPQKTFPAGVDYCQRKLAMLKGSHENVVEVHPFSHMKAYGYKDDHVGVVGVGWHSWLARRPIRWSRWSKSSKRS